jgi:ribokinase
LRRGSSRRGELPRPAMERAGASCASMSAMARGDQPMPRSSTQSAIDVLVIGGANTDFLVRGPSLPAPGASVEGDEFQQANGGKGANQAVAALRLGAKVAFVARVGADERGAAIVAQLSSDGVDVRAIATDASAATGVALVMVDAGGEKQILTAPGANRRLASADIVSAGELIASAKVVLLQLEVPLEAVETAVRLSRAAGAHVVLDPAPPRELSEELLRNVHVIRPNAAEAETLTGIVVSDQASARRAAANLLSRGAGAAVIGAPGGDLLLSAEDELWLPHLPVDVVDATGAGDAFAAALAVCLARGEDLRSAATFANAAAALATTRLGAQAGLPSHAEVIQLLARTRRK